MQYGGRATEDVARGPEVTEKWSHYPFLCYLGVYLFNLHFVDVFVFRFVFGFGVDFY